MADEKMALADLLVHVDTLAQASLGLWDLPLGSMAVRINVSENVTYRVDVAAVPVAVLRVHRQGYHSLQAIQSELNWLAALDRDEVVATPAVIAGRDGQAVQRAASGPLAPRHMVLFEHLPGHEPVATEDLTANFAELGRIAARLHHHVQSWTPPSGFERLVWDEEAVFGAQATWGDWRAAPHVAPVRDVLEAAERAVRSRLAAFGKAPDRYGLIHADMRLANLLVEGGQTRLIDFDDCGFGWFLYDFAAAISFLETDPCVPALKAAWLKGYRGERALSAAEEAELNTFILLRRLALLAWIGSHSEAPEPQALAPDFAAGTAQLARAYLQAYQRA